MLLKKLLGEILAEMGFVTKQHLDEALAKQRKISEEKALPERLQRTRLISEARLATNTTPALGQILIDMGADVNMPSLQVDHIPFNSNMGDRRLLGDIYKDFPKPAILVRRNFNFREIV